MKKCTNSLHFLTGIEPVSPALAGGFFFFFLFFFFYLFIYLFIFIHVCVGSLFLCQGFL